MKWRQASSIVVVASVLLVSTGAAVGGLVDNVQEMLGIAKGGDKVKEGMTEMALTLRETTNQFGALAADLHSGGERAARARAIFQGILGRAVSAGEAPAIGISVQLVTSAPARGATAAVRQVYPHPLHVDVWPTGTEADEWVKLRFADQKNTAFIANPLNVVTFKAQTPEDVRARVLKTAREARERRNRCTGKAFDAEQRDRTSIIEKCAKEYEETFLTDTVLSVLPEVQTAPAVSTHTQKLTGGFFAAILSKKPELEELLKVNPDAAVEAWVHDMGPTRKRLDAFEKTNWRAPISDWLKHCVDTGTGAAGVICYIFVDQKVASMPELYAYYQELKRNAAAKKGQ